MLDGSLLIVGEARRGAGCPVVVKTNFAHPGTSELVGRAVQVAVAACGLPAGTFALLFDAGFAVGQALISDHRIRAVGFIGSRRGADQNRREAQAAHSDLCGMGSINPVIIGPK